MGFYLCIHLKRLTVDGVRRIAHLYGAAVTSLFPYLDVYAYNYQSGMLKPAP